jgi:hypothetical protein
MGIDFEYECDILMAIDAYRMEILVAGGMVKWPKLD